MTDTSREAFEAYAITLYKNISLEKDDGEYRYALAGTGWKWWQASRKALEAEQAQAVEPTVKQSLIVGERAELIERLLECLSGPAALTTREAAAIKDAADMLEADALELTRLRDLARDADTAATQLQKQVLVLKAQQVAVPVPLSDEQIESACRFIEPSFDGPIAYDLLIARAIEAAHGIGAKP